MVQGWEIRVRGLVQGVGFRPFVWRLANAAGLSGEVLNDSEGVIIRLACSQAERVAFQTALTADMPPLARIDGIEVKPVVPPAGWQGFAIAASLDGVVTTGIVPDAATCPDCLSDISDPQNRRYGYAFTNCTNCGPRLSITRAIPYDRSNTAMAGFEMCAACQSEYDDPADRRFHAQPNACPDCGPQLVLRDGDKQLDGDPVEGAAKALRAGRIVAIKGLGGVQLAVDAGNAEAVGRLRERKRRVAKPLACMARDLKMVARYSDMAATARRLLTSSQAPIVLLRKSGEALAPAVAPGQNRLGMMLPNAPLHHLLMARLDRPVVLTSGNLSDQPQITDNDEALNRLAGIADFWLLHDRDIVNRLDDSVVQIIAGRPQILRRARGYAPAPLRLHKGFAKADPVLATGADLKNTFCLLKDGQAIVSQHMGDMENPETQRDFAANLDLYRQIYDFTPAIVATDMHPGYFSTRLGQQIADGETTGTYAVQHHHAHIAAVLAEHGLGPDSPPVLGVVLDGLGHGADGSIWGGEFLLADFRGFERVAHFPAVALPGGDKANRQPWRNALAHLLAAFGPDVLTGLEERCGKLPCLAALKAKPVTMLAQMIAQNVNAPKASSAGRLFDAVAAVLGICFETVQYEGEAAMQLQAMAEGRPQETGFYPLDARPGYDWKPLWQGIFSDLSGGTPADVIAARFHNSLIRLVAGLATGVTGKHDVDTVVLTGGVFQNALLLDGVKRELEGNGLKVLTPAEFPANDGGIALGQAVIAACRQPQT
jgi:hydrogenase maturation protein HypF